MLKLSKLTDYGIVVMTHLAQEPYQVHAAGDVAARSLATWSLSSP